MSGRIVKGALAILVICLIGGAIALASMVSEDESGSRDQSGETPPGDGAPDDDSAGSEGSPDDDSAGSEPSDSGVFGDLLGGDLFQCLSADVAPGEEAGGHTGRDQVGAIARAVEKIRKLRFSHRIHTTFLPPGQLADKAVQLFLESYPIRTAAAEQRLLSALGAISPEMELRQVTAELLRTQVAGFYVPETDDLYVPGAPQRELSGLERTILAHELEHAVADQRLDIPVPEIPDPAELDEGLAALSLVEGDATLTMQRYSLGYLSVAEQLGMGLDPAIVASQAALEDIPHYLVRNLEFPYLEGLSFVCDLYERGGWRAVDRAYAHPPRTTAEILFPDRYGSADEPASNGATGAPGSGWTRLLSSSFGAANLLWLFEAPGGDESLALSDARERVAAWAGGSVQVWKRGTATALALSLLERRDSSGLCESVTEWYDASFDDSEGEVESGETLARDGENQDAVVWCSGLAVRVGIAPDLATARRLVHNN